MPDQIYNLLFRYNVNAARSILAECALALPNHLDALGHQGDNAGVSA